MAANYNYFEGLTIRNTELAFWAGYKNITGASGITIKNCKLENIGRGVYSDWSGSKDFYIADNTFVGKFRPDILMGFTGREWQAYPEFGAKLVSEYAVKLYGQGHVVAYNYVTQFHDGIDIATYGNPDGAPNCRLQEPRCRFRSISTTTTSPTWRTTASKPTAARTISASSAIAASIMEIARSACSRCSADRCTSSATSCTIRRRAGH